MISSYVYEFFIKIFIIYFLSVLFYYYLLLNRKLRIQDRFTNYIVNNNKKSNKKIFDNLFESGINLEKNISKILYKLKIFNAYANRYQKYIKKSDRHDVDKMDYVSRKIIISFLFIIIVVIYTFFKNEELSLFKILISFLVGFTILDVFLLSNDKILKKERENDLLRAITIMNNSFRSGHSIMQSIKLVSVELDSPLGLEFKKMYVDLTYGLDVEVVFKRFESRVNMDEVKYITASLAILNETGGDIVKVFESVEKTFFNNKKLKDELENLTAASKFLYYILLSIPVLFVFIIYLLDNTYFNILFTNLFGYFIVIICFILYISYIFIVKKIMKLGDIYD